MWGHAIFKIYFNARSKADCVDRFQDMILALDHLQIAIPKGSEDTVRPFYFALGFQEVPKPFALAGRGGFWAVCGALNLHVGVDPKFAPATKAHPAFVMADLDEVVTRLEQLSHAVKWDTKLIDVRRCFASDPVGNRVELIAG